MSIDLKIFDLGAIERSGGAQRKEELNTFVHTLREEGFIGIKVENLESTINKAYEVTEKYFSLSIDVKNQEAALRGNPNGYHGVALEKLGNLEKMSTGQIEHKESFLIMGGGKGPTIEGSEHIEECRIKLHQTANKILHFIQEYYQIADTEKCDFEDNSALSVTRLTHYLPMQSAPSNSVWCGSHQDINPFALLPKATKQGLQLQGKDGQWLDVKVPENTVIVNTGRFFEAVTGGQIKPTFHRVVAKSLSESRYSIIYFPCWKPDYHITPWKSCLALSSADPALVKRLPHGKVSSLFSLYLAMGGIIELSQEEIRKVAQEIPDNEFIRERWPWAYSGNT